MRRIGNANTGLIAYLTDNAERIVAAGEAQRPNPAATAAFLVFAGGHAAMTQSPDRLWPLFAVVGLVGVGAAVKARRAAGPDDVAGRLGIWILVAGSFAALVLLTALGLD
jgi:hypothetical protein